MACDKSLNSVDVNAVKTALVKLVEMLVQFILPKFVSFTRSV